MWNDVSHIILRQRVWVLVVLTAITGFFASNLPYNEVSYDLSRLLPVGDSTSIVFKDFKETFGANDNVYLVSTEDSNFYHLDKFQQFYDFTLDIEGTKVKICCVHTLGEARKLMEQIDRMVQDWTSVRDRFGRRWTGHSQM